MRTWLVLLFSVPSLGADWVKVSAPEAVVFTDAGEKSARTLLARLAELRALFSEGITETPAATRLQIFLFSSVREFRGYADSPQVDGFYRSGPGYERIVLHAGTDAQRALAHEYTHLLLKRSHAGRFPAWLEEGMAEFYSTLTVNDAKATAGTPIAPHRALLAKGEWLAASELFSATTGDHSSGGMLYAQGWALVHMLNLAPGYREHVPGFFTQLLSGEPAWEAFLKAFSRTPERALTDLQSYLARMVPVTVDAAAADQSTADTEPLTQIESITARAELAFHTNHPDLARKLLANGARANPDSPAIEAALGLQSGFDDDRSGAIRHLERAIALGSQEAWVRFELAQREREAGAPAGQIDKRLREAIALDPEFAEAWFLLGVQLTDQGDPAAAIPLLEAAARVEPARSSYWHALAFALEKSGRSAAALDAAQKAVRTARNATEDSMATALRDSLRTK